METLLFRNSNFVTSTNSFVLNDFLLTTNRFDETLIPSKHNGVDIKLKIRRNNGLVFLIVLVTNLRRRTYDFV